MAFKKMSDGDVEKICKILDGWRGKLTWEALAAAAQPAVRHLYTRQALIGHDRIKMAFQVTKGRLRAQDEQKPSKSEIGSVEVKAAIERMERLQAQVERLEKENKALLLQFRRWAYNASINGLDLDALDRPLPQIDRARTLTLHKTNKKRR